jgi:hypothetical protein
VKHNSKRPHAGEGDAQEHNGGTHLRAELTEVYRSSLGKTGYVTLCRFDKQPTMGSGKGAESSC